jgi:hypothetical protein
LNRPQTPMHKARVAVGSPPSAPLNGITELFDKPLLLWGEKPLCGWESCKSSPRAREPSALQPHHAQLRKKRIKSNKEPVWRCSTGASGLPRRRSGGSRWHLSQDLSNVASPTKAIITIPITLYGNGNGDDAEDGGPERRRDGREHGEHKADKARRCSRSARPLGITEMYQVPATSRPRFISPLLREGVAAE